MDPVGPRRPLTATPQDRYRVTNAIERLARSGRVRVQDPTVRATLYALAEIGLLRGPARKQSTPMPFAVGARRRIQALAHEGWTLREIGAVIGMTDRALKDIRSGKTQRISAATHVALKELYDSGIYPDGNPRDAGRVRGTAVREQWPTRADWADKDIDHPDTQPAE